MSTTPRSYGIHAPLRVLSGAGCLQALPAELDALGVERAFLLSTRSLADHLAPIEALLGKRHVGSFAHCRQHSPSGDVEEVAGLAKGADVLVTFGGGSVIDTAKAVAHRLDKQPQVAIPTTLSAGEFTPFAGVTDEATRRKGGVFDPAIQPRLVIHDPEVTRRTPEALWLSTGMRSVDHALETLWARRPHPYSDTLAAEALRLLWTRLPESRDPDSLEARTDCQLGAWLSISGMMNVGTRLSHPLGHQIGAFWNVPHGVTSCITLPHVMRHLAPQTQAAQQRIARIFGVATPEEAAVALEEFIAALGVPTRLRETAARREELGQVAQSVRDELAHFGAAGADEVEALLEAMW